MSAVCLSHTQMKDVLKPLSDYGAKTVLIKNLIQMTTNGFTFGKFEVWVDVWPKFNALIIKWDWTNTPVTRIENYYYVFSTSNESFKQILEVPGMIKLEKAEFVAIDEERRSTLEMFAKEHGYHLDCNEKAYDLFCVTEDDLVKVSAPKDLIAGNLTSEWAGLVAKNWIYTEEDKFDSYEQFIKLLIDTYPNVCLYDSKNQPVAYAIGQEYGAIGMLYVDPKYRGRGCAKAIMSILSQKYLSENLTTCIVVDVANTLSVSLNTKLGYKPTQSRINWYPAYPDTSKN